MSKVTKNRHRHILLKTFKFADLLPTGFRSRSANFFRPHFSQNQKTAFFICLMLTDLPDTPAVKEEIKDSNIARQCQFQNSAKSLKIPSCRLYRKLLIFIKNKPEKHFFAIWGPQISNFPLSTLTMWAPRDRSDNDNLSLPSLATTHSFSKLHNNHICQCTQSEGQLQLKQSKQHRICWEKVSPHIYSVPQ